LRRLIEEAGHDPKERDTLYNEVIRSERKWQKGRSLALPVVAVCGNFFVTETIMRFAILSLLFIIVAPAFADHKEKMPARKAVLLDGLGGVHHPVSTKSAEAQKFFDQGLRLIYAFNHDEALLAFERAAELDPNLAMAHWGMALAVGPNYNLDADAEALKRAYASIKKALALSKNAPQHEQDYIKSLSLRYSDDPKAPKHQLANNYSQGMKFVHLSYPDDLNAATLYAESLMNQSPWELWNRDGKPNANTPEILRVLEGVLKRNPDHTGANHYYIHAIEASPYPERGLAAADRLGKLAPKAGHLVHMPAHIYARVGDHAASARANQEAANVDREYIHKFKIHGVYPMMYYSHNLHFLAVAHAMQGRYADAKKAANELAAHVGPHVKEMPMLEGFLPTSMLVDVRFQKWNEILATPRPDAKQKITLAMWQFARATALLSRDEKRGLDTVLGEFDKAVRDIPYQHPYSNRNPCGTIFRIADAMLKARVAMSRKQHKDAIFWLEKAVAAEDELNYIEPPDWPLPCREVLGAVYFREKRYADAEKTFRADLVHNPRNPRSLFGLMETLKAQDKTFAARSVEHEFRVAWKNADEKALSLDGY
jgi:tetratricopeptide (TPR) repeat protein